jgi:hypothetical protein
MFALTRRVPPRPAVCADVSLQQVLRSLKHRPAAPVQCLRGLTRRAQLPVVPAGASHRAVSLSFRQCRPDAPAQAYRRAGTLSQTRRAHLLDPSPSARDPAQASGTCTLSQTRRAHLLDPSPSARGPAQASGTCTLSQTRRTPIPRPSLPGRAFARVSGMPCTSFLNRKRRVPLLSLLLLMLLQPAPRLYPSPHRP